MPVDMREFTMKKLQVRGLVGTADAKIIFGSCYWFVCVRDTKGAP